MELEIQLLYQELFHSGYGHIIVELWESVFDDLIKTATVLKIVPIVYEST